MVIYLSVKCGRRVETRPYIAERHATNMKMSNTVKCDIVKKMCMLSGESAAKSVSFMVTCKYGMHWNGFGRSSALYHR